MTCQQDAQNRAKNGVLDMTYVERRLDGIEERIEDLTKMLEAVLEQQGITEVKTFASPTCKGAVEGGTCECFEDALRRANG
jgi:hypothetical protein